MYMNIYKARNNQLPTHVENGNVANIIFRKMKKKLYETPVCTVIPLPEEYLLLTKSPVARPGGGGETGHKGSISVGDFDDGGSEEIEDED